MLCLELCYAFFMDILDISMKALDISLWMVELCIGPLLPVYVFAINKELEKSV